MPFLLGERECTCQRPATAGAPFQPRNYPFNRKKNTQPSIDVISSWVALKWRVAACYVPPREMFCLDLSTQNCQLVIASWVAQKMAGWPPATCLHWIGDVLFGSIKTKYNICTVAKFFVQVCLFKISMHQQKEVFSKHLFHQYFLLRMTADNHHHRSFFVLFFKKREKTEVSPVITYYMKQCTG